MATVKYQITMEVEVNGLNPRLQKEETLISCITHTLEDCTSIRVNKVAAKEKKIATIKQIQVNRMEFWQLSVDGIPLIETRTSSFSKLVRRGYNLADEVYYNEELQKIKN